jgi:hypothetical protein
VKLRIKDIHFLDRITERITKIGFTFYYESDEDRANTAALQVEPQIAKIMG